jgi:hypothetical protein
MAPPPSAKDDAATIARASELLHTTRSQTLFF